MGYDSMMLTTQLRFSQNEINNHFVGTFMAFMWKIDSFLWEEKNTYIEIERE